MVVNVYTKKGCPFCTRAKTLLKDNGFDFAEIVINTEAKDYEDVRAKLILQSGGHRTYPFIFVGDIFIGGFRELEYAYSTLRLHELVRQEGGQVPEIDF
nr:glutaredoxin [Sicyoidochytrium minutum DNA virus]